MAQSRFTVAVPMFRQSSNEKGTIRRARSAALASGLGTRAPVLTNPFSYGCHDVKVQFEEELHRVLPPDLPHRARLIEKAVQHLQMIESANEYMNLTRITSPREAAIKHVYDSVAPWRYFQNSKHILDAGTGAGFPGVPLSIVLPEVRFTLAESIGKKARFVDCAADALGLSNVYVLAERAETVASKQRVDTITARALAPISRHIELFGAALKSGARLLLYKGPDVQGEIAEAQRDRIKAEVLCRYDLPDSMGTRTLVQLQAQGR
jgi:16S rRNA (guanine527-N7)-methyltransferase